MFQPSAHTRSHGKSAGFGCQLQHTLIHTHAFMLNSWHICKRTQRAHTQAHAHTDKNCHQMCKINFRTIIKCAKLIKTFFYANSKC